MKIIKACKNPMSNIADVLKCHAEFILFCDDFEEFYNLPEKRTLAISNDILNSVYDIVDNERIWIE